MTSRFNRGLEKLKEVDGEQGEHVLAALADVAPDFARYVVEFPFGDIYARPGLDLRTRELVAIAALAALGNAPAQLRVHVNGALNVSCSREEIIEVIMQMAVFAGFPAALNAIAAAREVFTARADPATDRAQA